MKAGVYIDKVVYEKMGTFCVPRVYLQSENIRSFDMAISQTVKSEAEAVKIAEEFIKQIGSMTSIPVLCGSGRDQEEAKMKGIIPG